MKKNFKMKEIGKKLKNLDNRNMQVEKKKE